MAVYFDEIPDLLLHSVVDRGQPNKERIVIRALGPLSLDGCGVMLAREVRVGLSVPIQDNLLWLGGGRLATGDWLFIYTCPGEATIAPLAGSNDKLVSVYWGKKQTVFHDPEVVPIVFRIGEANVIEAPPPPEPLEQLGHEAQPSAARAGLINSPKK